MAEFKRCGGAQRSEKRGEFGHAIGGAEEEPSAGKQRGGERLCERGARFWGKVDEEIAAEDQMVLRGIAKGAGICQIAALEIHALAQGAMNLPFVAGALSAGHLHVLRDLAEGTLGIDARACGIKA